MGWGSMWWGSMGVDGMGEVEQHGGAMVLGWGSMRGAGNVQCKCLM